MDEKNPAHSGAVENASTCTEEIGFASLTD